MPSRCCLPTTPHAKTRPTVSTSKLLVGWRSSMIKVNVYKSYIYINKPYSRRIPSLQAIPCLIILKIHPLPSTYFDLPCNLSLLSMESGNSLHIQRLCQNENRHMTLPQFSLDYKPLPLLNLFVTVMPELSLLHLRSLSLAFSQLTLHRKDQI